MEKKELKGITAKIKEFRAYEKNVKKYVDTELKRIVSEYGKADYTNGYKKYTNLDFEDNYSGIAHNDETFIVREIFIDHRKPETVKLYGSYGTTDDEQTIPVKHLDILTQLDVLEIATEFVDFYGK